MTTLGAKIRERRNELGLTQSQVANAFGIKRNAVSLWEADETKPSADKISKLANILEVSSSWLLDEKDVGVDVGRQPNADLRGLLKTVRPDVSGPVPLPEESDIRMPILGTANGGADGAIIFDGDPIAWAKTPDYLIGVRNAYAVYVRGESMIPRYRPGERLDVHPTKPPRQSDDVIVQLYSEDQGGHIEGYVKEYVSLNSTKLIVRQFNPPLDIEYPIERVKAIHVIVGMKRE